MENFTFYNPVKMIYGKGEISKIGEEISMAGVNKVLLIAGGGSVRKNSVYDQVTESLVSNKVEWVEIWGVQPNPNLETVREMVNFAIKEDVGAVLAVGGGSVIDTSKAVAAGAVLNEDVWTLFEAGEEVINALPIFTVLTLSATGTEMDELAVVTNEPECKKWAIFGRGIFPKVSIVDPSVQAQLPWFQTVNGAVDALSHVMEQYFSGKNADTTMSIAESLMKSIIKAADKLQMNPNDYDARADLAWASSLALNGIIRTGTGLGDWATHGIEHGISAIKTNVAHGAGLAVVFPAWIEYIGSDEQEAFARWSRNVWDCDSLDEALLAFKNKIKRWGHPSTLSDLGVTDEDIDPIVTSIMQRSLGRIKVLTETDVRAILDIASKN